MIASLGTGMPHAKSGKLKALAVTYYTPEEYQPGHPPAIITVPDEKDLQALEEDIKNPRAQPDVVGRNDPKFQEILEFTDWVSDQHPHRFRAEGDEVVVDTSAS